MENSAGCVRGCILAIVAYHRIVDLAEIRIVDASRRPMILIALVSTIRR